MSPETLRHKLRQTPFSPFEVVLSSGSRYPVKGPEHLVVGNRSSVLWLPAPGQDDDLVYLDNLHITEAPPLVAAVANG